MNLGFEVAPHPAQCADLHRPREQDFDTTDVLEVDNEVPGPLTAAGIATLHYEAPDGSVVVVDLALDADGGPGAAGSECTLTGVAIGG